MNLQQRPLHTTLKLLMFIFSVLAAAMKTRISPFGSFLLVSRSGHARIRGDIFACTRAKSFDIVAHADLTRI